MGKNKVLNIDSLKEDDMNFNLGTLDGDAMINASFEEFGAGRSILIDRDNNIVAGNKSTRAAKNNGIRNVRVVETDGTKLVVVKRTDISLDSRIGREMALADNTTSLFNLAWDKGMMERAAQKYDDIDMEKWGIDLSNTVNDAQDNRELDVNLFEDVMTLTFRLTEEEYNRVSAALVAIDANVKKALLKIIGYGTGES